MDQQVVLLATEQAKDNWQKDAAFRRWATQHGGLYVRTDERTPPNPGLAHLPHRDVETTSGTQLTLMNPAYMMRQMTQEFEQMYGVKGKITGKVLLNPPVNEPDGWEYKILDQFEAGTLEPATEVQDIDDEPYLRYMEPMLMTSEGCVTCHGHLGFKLGDVRGGVSVSIPLAGYQTSMKETKRSASFSHWGGWLIGMLGIWVYIGRKTQQESLQREMERKIQRALRMGSIGQMAGGIAHDFNNILNIVVGNADLLKMKLSDKKQIAQLEKVVQAAQRGSKLTHQLLDFARGETGDLSIFDPAKSLTNVLDMLEATIPGDIAISRQVSKEDSLIKANKNRFEDSITNLILNAIDALAHTENGNIQVTLDFEISDETLSSKTKRSHKLVQGITELASSQVADQYCHIRIEDNGSGMSEDTLERLFEPFYTTKSQGKGTGLGLSQVYGFIQAHVGHIEVQSTLGVGTLFDLYLPLTSQAETQKDISADATQWEGAETVLIVDDEPEVGAVIKQYLDDLGYTTFVEQNAKAALTQLENMSIDVLITDVMMPEMNGYQFALAVRERFPDLPVIYISGYSVKDLEKRYPQALENSIKLLKPIRQIELAKNLRSKLNNHE